MPTDTDPVTQKDLQINSRADLKSNNTSSLQGTSINEDTCNNLLRLGAADVDPKYRTIQDAIDATNQIPGGKSGIVLGSGPHTDEWREKGWQTLDIDARFNPDLKGDAQTLDELTPPGTNDYVLAEHIRFDPKGVDGVARGALLKQMNLALKDGGVAIVETASIINGGKGQTTPDQPWFLRLMQAHGFDVISVCGKPTKYFDPDGQEVVQRKITYYGRKIHDSDVRVQIK